MLPLELLTTTEMAEAERLAMASGTPGIELMERAGAGVVDIAARLAGTGQKIAVLCGPGNNGGDGFVAARLSRARGFDVTAGLLGATDALKEDAAEAARRWGGPIVPIEDLALDGATVVIDALFGSGLARDLGGAAKTAVERLNDFRRASGRPVVAVDVPSGLDANTGAIRGVAVEASATVSFFRARPGHLLFPGRRLCGELHVHDIGIVAETLKHIAPRNAVNQPTLWRAALPFPAVEGHKYSRGHALVVSGGPWSTGAARLSARGALRAGAGLVTLASPREALTINASHLTAIMIAPCDEATELAALLEDRRFTSVVLGPGLGIGAHTRALIHAALGGSHPRTIVLDADALTSFADAHEDFARAIAASGKTVIATPHEGEFGRLFGPVGGAGDKLSRARAAAQASGAIVLLKGPDTIIAAPDGRAAIACETTPWLATAGSGDVLAGIIGGLSAQGMAGFEAACAGAWMHACAGIAAGPGLIAEDLPEALRGVVQELAV